MGTSRRVKEKSNPDSQTETATTKNEMKKEEDLITNDILLNGVGKIVPLSVLLVGLLLVVYADLQNGNVRIRTWKECELVGVDSWSNCLKGLGDCKFDCRIVPVVQWGGKEKAIYLERPMVFENSPSDEWELTKGVTEHGLNWFMNAIGGAETIVHNVFKAKSTSILYFNPSMPMAASKNLKWEKPFEHVNMRVVELIELMNQTKIQNSYYYYYSCSIFDEKELLPIVNMLTEKNTKPFQAVNEDESENRNIHIWMGDGNTITRTHYDTYHNFYIQLHGEKEFTLFPPSEWENLHLYPVVHPSARNSQIEFGEKQYNRTRYPNFSKVGAPQKVVLQPGQVLYLPPFWFHQVRSLTPSLSINIWSNSKPALIGSNINNEAIPFVDDKTLSDIELDVAVFQMASKVIKMLPNAKEWIKSVIETQYVSFSHQLVPPSNVLDVILVHKLSCSKLLQENIKPELERRVDTHAKFIVDEFLKIHDIHIRSINFGVFVTGIANWSVDVTLIPTYLDCLLINI